MATMLEKIQEYIKAKEIAKQAVALEKKLRVELLEDLFDEHMGVLNTFSSGYMIKGTFGTNIKFDGASYIDALEAGDISEAVTDVVDFKPTLNKTAYKGLDEDVSAELDDFITTSPALPTIVIKEATDD